ncbi:MAG: lipocalin family protein [Allomuricauda sp.]
MKPLESKLYMLICGMLLCSCGGDDGPSNQIPEKAVLTNPAHQTQGADIENLGLQWQQATDPDGDPVLYDVFLGSTNPPMENVTSDLNTTNFSVEGPLEFNTIYYWNISAKDGNGGSSQSEIFSFTTREANPEELIVGKWFINEALINGVPQTITECGKTSYFEFEANGTLTVVQYEGDPCTISSSTILDYSMPDGTTLLLTNGSITETVPIVSLTETTLGLILETVQYNFAKEVE